MPPVTDLPVTMVVLYSSGVGYFEHVGEIEGNGATELRFKAPQINDVLKSLVLQDMGGGKIGTVEFPSHDPIARSLKSFSVDLTDNPSLAALLTQLRGAAVTLSLATETLDGTILGLEKRPRAFERATIDVWYLNLVVGGAIRSMAIDSLQSVTLKDPALQQDLIRALTVVAQARDQEKKPMTLHFTGEGKRRVRIGYVVESPVWKTSYRLILPEAGSADSAHLQGWAIIENQTDNDWPAIALTLVSGRPVSFVQELYQPTYIPRPRVQPEFYSSLQPQLYAGGASAAAAPQEELLLMAAKASGGTAAHRRASRMAPIASAPAAAMEPDMDVTASVQSAAEASKLGELFQYTVPAVSLPRQRSAMIPIVTDAVSAERVSIFNEAVLRKHPLYGVRLHNTSGKHLLQGPVTVLEAAAYAGDARIDNLPPGQHRYLSYGIDLEMQVNTNERTGRAVIQTATIAKGVIELEEKLLNRKEYAVENKGAKARVLLIEHPIEAAYSLVDTPAPVETTETHYRLRYDVGAGEAKTIVVQSQWIRARRIGLSDELAATLQIFVQAAGVPMKVRAALEDVILRRREINDLEKQISTVEEQAGHLNEEQERIRENLKTVPEGSQYHNRLLAKLNEQETRFEKLQEEIDRLRAMRERESAALAEHVAGLSVIGKE